MRSPRRVNQSLDSVRGSFTIIYRKLFEIFSGDSHRKNLSPGGKRFLEFTWGYGPNFTMKPKSSPYESYLFDFIILVAELSGGLWVHIQIFETTLRQFLAKRLTAIYGTQSWWDIPFLLNKDDYSNISKVMQRLKGKDIQITSEHVVDNLSLSFWIKLLGKRYHETIWLKIIKYMPVYPGRREDFYNKAREIRNLRNSIAHHGPIMRRDLIRDHAYLGELTAILDPELAREVEKRSRVQE